MNPWRHVGGYGVSANADDKLLHLRARNQDSEPGMFVRQPRTDRVVRRRALPELRE